MKKLLVKVVDFLVAAVILAVPGVVITLILSPVLDKPLKKLFDTTGVIYLVLALLILVMGKKVRKQVKENILEKAKSASAARRKILELFMNCDGVVLTAAAGLSIMLIPVFL